MSRLKIKGLTVGYRNRKVISDINFEAWKGQIVCILGPNGSGKTTILRSIAGLLAPLEGIVYLNDYNLKTYSRRQLAQNMAVVLTEKISVDYMRVFDFIASGRHPHTNFLGKLTQEDYQKIEAAIDWVKAENIRDKFLNELSDGERQKAMVARALAQDTQLIILDEPTSFLDLRHRVELIALLNRLSKEKEITIILSLHDVELALKTCELIVLVKNGQIIGYGPVDQIIQEETINHLYNLEQMNFDLHLGSLELTCNNTHPKIFVVGGGGCGTPFYRALVKQGWGIATGIIYENDLDFFVGKTIQIQMVSEKPFEIIRHSTLDQALKLMTSTEIIVDTGFPNGQYNQANIELLKKALEYGKPVVSLRDKSDTLRLLGDLSSKIVHKRDLAEILAWISS